MKPSRRHSAGRGTLNNSAVIGADCSRRLLELRSFTGETQKQLAKRLGMTDSMISRLERGNHLPNLATLCRIGNAFGRRVEIVFHEHEHVHANGTRHSHRHSHDDPDHPHRDEAANRTPVKVTSPRDARRKRKYTPLDLKAGVRTFKFEKRGNASKAKRARPPKP